MFDNPFQLLLHTNGIINIIGETAMKVLETTKDGATVQLTKEEVRLIGALSLEVFHGAFRLECKTLWQTVAMPIPFKRAAEIMHQFQDLACLKSYSAPHHRAVCHHRQRTRLAPSIMVPNSVRSADVGDMRAETE